MSEPRFQNRQSKLAGRTRLENAAEAAELRGHGLLQREIAERMGVSIKTVNAWLKDPDGSRLKARKDSYRGRCEDCGSPTDGSNGSSKAPRWCSACVGAHNPRTQGRAERVLEMVRLRNEENLTNKQIAERLGVPVGTISTELSRMRALGFLVPAAPYNNVKAGWASFDGRDPQALGRALERYGIDLEVRRAA